MIWLFQKPKSLTSRLNNTVETFDAMDTAEGDVFWDKACTREELNTIFVSGWMYIPVYQTGLQFAYFLDSLSCFYLLAVFLTQARNYVCWIQSST